MAMEYEYCDKNVSGGYCMVIQPDGEVWWYFLLHSDIFSYTDYTRNILIYFY